jgi:hypothetical protein
MKLTIGELKHIIQETLDEDLKNVHSKHEKTSTGSAVLRKMHDAPGVLEMLSKIKSPKELAQVIEAILDAVPVVRRDDVLKALTTVQRHERSTRR